jgi:outer membrane protein assembly factor BamE
MIKKYKLWLILPVFLFGCAGIKFSEWRFPYMMEVQQGNYITNNQVNQLHVGMTKEQVSFIIGHPLTQFLFDQNRWDFFYQDYKSNKLETNYCITILFDKEGKVISISKSGQFFNK